MSVHKGTFLLLREGVTSPMEANYMVKILLLKSLKFRSFRRIRPLKLDPHNGRFPGPTGGLKAVPNSMPLKK